MSITKIEAPLDQKGDLFSEIGCVLAFCAEVGRLHATPKAEDKDSDDR